jgi:hypothetical protein
VGRVAELGALGVMQRALPILLVALLAATSGCSYGLRKFNAPSQEKLQIQTVAATNCTVRIVGADKTETFSPAADGRVTLDVPRLPRGCDVHLFGFIKIEDGGPENVSAIHVLRGDKVVRKLSLTKLRKLPVDAKGYHILVLR